jgi:hypothetical protein
MPCWCCFSRRPRFWRLRKGRGRAGQDQVDRHREVYP